MYTIAIMYHCENTSEINNQVPCVPSVRRVICNRKLEVNSLGRFEGLTSQALFIKLAQFIRDLKPINYAFNLNFGQNYYNDFSFGFELNTLFVFDGKLASFGFGFFLINSKFKRK